MTSVSPYLCEKITNGQCKMLVRKSAPKETPFKAYIYCCKDNAKEIVLLKDYKNRFSFGDYRKADGHFYGVVIGEFICDKVEVLFNTNGNPENYMTDILPTVLQKTALSFKEFQDYVGSRSDKNNIYGWHISDLKIYDKPKELSEFKTPPCEKPEKACGNCQYRVVINTPDMYEVDCFVANGREISRPPRSYMYVEEILL
jgi:predicted transcriptional regulator